MQFALAYAKLPYTAVGMIAKLTTDITTTTSTWRKVSLQAWLITYHLCLLYTH